MSIRHLSKHAYKGFQRISIFNAFYSELRQLKSFGGLLILTSCFMAGCSVESAPARWQLTQTGVYEHYQAAIDCETMPDTGSFQKCQVTFQTTSGEPAELMTIQIEGGMPTHGHGLPTSPKLRLLSKPGTYQIDGLKYNMPGAWLLGFKVNGEYGEDQIVFDFVI